MKGISKDKSFIFYHDFKFIINFLSQEQKGDLLDALISYSEDGQQILGIDKPVENAFLYIKNRIDDNAKKRNILRENALKGGNPNFKKGKSNPYYHNQNITDVLPKDNQKITKTLPKDNLNVNVKANVKANVNSKDNNKPPTPFKKEFDLSFIDRKDFKDLFSRWMQYRREVKKPYKSKMSVQSAYKDLLKLSNTDLSVAKNIVEQSICRQWQGLFALKEDFKNKNNEVGYAKPVENKYPS